MSRRIAIDIACESDTCGSCVYLRNDYTHDWHRVCSFVFPGESGTYKEYVHLTEESKPMTAVRRAECRLYDIGATP